MALRRLFLLTALSTISSQVQCYTFPELSEKQHISFRKNMDISREGISASTSIRWGRGDFPRQVNYPFQNTSLPWDARVDDLVSRLSLQEIMVQMARGGAGEYTTPAPAIPRLGKLSVALWWAHPRVQLKKEFRGDYDSLFISINICQIRILGASSLLD